MSSHRGIVLLALLAFMFSCRQGSHENGGASAPGQTPPQTQRPPAPLTSANDTAKLAPTRSAESAAFGLPLGSLPPEIQKTLEKIRVLRLTDKNLDVVWSLEGNQGDYDVIVLDCSPETLSTSRIAAIVGWAKKGHGLLIQARHVALFDRQLNPSPYHLEFNNRYRPAELVSKGELVRDVLKVINFLWCSAHERGHSLTFLRDSTGGSGDLTATPAQTPEMVFTQRGGNFSSVLLDQYNQERYLVFASAYQGARVVWYSEDVDFSKECQPQYDDVRLWSNLMHWLAGEKSGDGNTP
jgi:hypothetical protein